jgi:hypothetical protein
VMGTTQPGRLISVMQQVNPPDRLLRLFILA